MKLFCTLERELWLVELVFVAACPLKLVVKRYGRKDLSWREGNWVIT